MEDMLNDITVEQAMMAYEEKGIAVTLDNGKVIAEVECEDYCN